MEPGKCVIFFLGAIALNLGLLNSALAETDSLAEASLSVGFYLTAVAQKELGVAQLEKVFRSKDAKDKHTKENPSDTINFLSFSISDKLKEMESFFNETSEAFRNFLSSSSSSESSSTLSQCCSVTLKRSINATLMCDATLESNKKPDDDKTLLAKIRDVIHHQPSSELFRRPFFFGGSHQFHLESSMIDLCHLSSLDAIRSKRRQIFTQLVHPHIQNVVIILERRSDQTGNELLLGRAAALNLLQGLPATVNVGVITITNNKIEMPIIDNVDKCIDSVQLQKASSSTIQQIQKHLSQIHHTNTESSLVDIDTVLSTMHRLINSSLPSYPVEKSMQVEVFYIAAWKTQDEDNAKKLKSYFTNKMNNHHFSSNLRVIQLIDDQQANPKDEMDVDEYLHKMFGYGVIKIVSMLDVSKLLDNPFVLTSLHQQQSMLNLDVDRWSTDRFILTISKVWNNFNDKEKTFILGFDIAYETFFESVISQPLSETNYFFILDKSSSQVVYHPKLFDKANEKVSPQIGQIGVEQLETPLSLHQVETIIMDQSGRIDIPDGSSYIWKHVQNSPFIVVGVIAKHLQVENQSSNDFINNDANDATDSDLLPTATTTTTTTMRQPRVVYHRLDVLPSKIQSKFCRHFSAPATLDSGSLFLADDAFDEPWLQPKVLKSQNVEAYMAYVTDKTNLISNPGIRPGVRSDVIKFAQIMPAWKNMSFDSGLNNYIIRRFAASKSGVYYAYPGSPLPVNFEPSLQDWFMKAAKFPSHVVTTLPRLDAGGAGYIVTLSQLLDFPDYPVVVGMDLTLGYMYKLLLETLPACRDNQVKCFLFDDEGYLVVHPDMFVAGEVQERQHLTFKEPLVAGDILRHTQIANKEKCLRHTDLTQQRFYSFNIRLTNILSKALKNDVISGTSSDDNGGCTRYRTSIIHGTNLFLGIVEPHANCSVSGASFCPCSVHDHLCILCDEDEEDAEDEDKATACECPCQCQLDKMKAKRNQKCQINEPEIVTKEKPCPPEAQHVDSLLPLPYDALMTSLPLPQCFERECGRRNTKESCLGVIGCSWCEQELTASGNGIPQQLSSPYCGELSRCFFGIVGTKSPYELSPSSRRHGDLSSSTGGRSPLRDGSQSSSASNEDFFFGQSHSSVGPIVGGIIGCFMFIAISVCCLRGQQKCVIISSFNDAGRNRNDSSLHVSNFEEDVDDEDKGEELQELSTCAADILRINSASNPGVVVSPYQINPSYIRRPPPGTDSDHGYSTMTPMGGDIESDIITPYVDSASARERLWKRPNFGAPCSLNSITSGVSSRTTSPNLIMPSIAGQGCDAITHSRILRHAESSALLSDEASDEASLSSSAMAVGQCQPGQTHLGRNQFIVAATIHMEETN